MRCNKNFPAKPQTLTVIRLLPLLVGWICLPGPAAGQDAAAAPPAAVITAITFAAEPGKLYVPLLEVAQFMGWNALCDWKTKKLMLNGIAVSKEERRRLADGTELVSDDGLGKGLAEVIADPSGQSVIVRAGKQFTLMRMAKRVEISLSAQQLTAWEGARPVLHTKISTGRYGRTPAGEFTAGPYKARRHYSRLYNRAPMPWSVQINGHIFIHGFSSVPNYPASRGCVRMPLTGANPARLFYEWVDPGTPVRILPVVKATPAGKSKKRVTGR